MKTAVIIFGALRQADLCAPTWKFPFPVDYHLVTWDFTQQAQCSLRYPSTNDLDLLKATEIKFETVTVLPYKEFLANWPSHHYGSRMIYHLYVVAQLLKNYNYERVIAIRNDLFLFPRIELTAELFDIKEHEVFVDGGDFSKNLVNDWLFMTRWNSFQKLAMTFEKLIDMPKWRQGQRIDIHEDLYHLLLIDGLTLVHQKLFETAIARPNSRIHRGEPPSMELLWTISKEFDIWREMTTGHPGWHPHGTVF